MLPTIFHSRYLLIIDATLIKTLNFNAIYCTKCCKIFRQGIYSGSAIYLDIGNLKQ